MNRNNPFQTLADQVMRGDPTAKARLREKLEPQMVHIVRQALQGRSEQTPIERQIFTAARCLGLENPRASRQDQDDFIRAVARCVCSQVIANLRSQQDSAFLTTETVADFADPALRMTA